jgi:hypothetical protein
MRKSIGATFRDGEDELPVGQGGLNTVKISVLRNKRDIDQTSSSQ